MTPGDEVDWSAVDGLSPAVLAGLHWHAWHAVEQPDAVEQVSAGARARRLARVPEVVARSPYAVVSFVARELELGQAGVVFAVWTPVQVGHAFGFIPPGVTEGIWQQTRDPLMLRLRVLTVAAAGRSVYAATWQDSPRVGVCLEAVTAAECGGRCIGLETVSGGGGRE